MIRRVRFILVLAAAILAQVSFFPAWLRAPFSPNLTIFFAIHLGLREPFSWSNCLAAFVIGLFQDCFSGMYFGLHGFTYLFVYFLLKQVSERLYTDNNLIIILAVFLGVILDGFLTLALLMLFSAADGIYVTLLAGLVPHAFVSMLAAPALISAVTWRSRRLAR